MARTRLEEVLGHPDLEVLVVRDREVGTSRGLAPALAAELRGAVVVDDRTIVASCARNPDLAVLTLEWQEPRAAVLATVDPDRLLTALGYGMWHERTRFCPTCGATLDPTPDGRILACAAGHQQFPRLEPAIIVRVIDGDGRLLLGRQAQWPERRFSVLAGFVDPGETAEAAVRREVAEEAGIGVGDVRYVGSQPWPFPASLMLAFEADATSTTIELADDELDEAAWFSRDELRAAIREDRVRVPSRLSVAHGLVVDWLGEGDVRTWLDD